MIPPDVLPWPVAGLIALMAVLLRRRPPWLRAAASVASVVLFTLVLLPVVGSLFQPDFGEAAAAGSHLSRKILVTLWWLLLSRTLVTAVRVVLRIHHRQHVARLASDLASGVVYLVTAIVVVDLAFGVSVTGLVATSGIIAVVVGLALQNTLADLFSGIALGIDRPFAVGDVVWIEGEISGRIIETTWRSTRVLTFGNDVATVPNSIVAKVRLLNRSTPDEGRIERVSVVLDPAVLPAQGVALLGAAALNAGALARNGLPDVSCVELSSFGTIYDIAFAVPFATAGARRTELLHQVARHARYAGVAIANRDGRPFAPAPAPALTSLIAENSVLRHLPAEERSALAAGALHHAGEAGDVLSRQGEMDLSLFIVTGGVMEGLRDEGHGPQRLGVLGPGDSFGHLSVATGVENPATVTALTRYAAVEITRSMLEPALSDNTALLDALAKGAARSRVVLHLDPVAAPVPPVAPVRPPLLARLRALLATED